MKEILKKVRKYEIEIRKFLNNSNQGNYSSVFKGTGLDFDDLRPYQYGDDYRAINWNITAKQNNTYINTYKEEKEQSIFFLLDVIPFLGFFFNLPFTLSTLILTISTL